MTLQQFETLCIVSMKMFNRYHRIALAKFRSIQHQTILNKNDIIIIFIYTLLHETYLIIIFLGWVPAILATEFNKETMAVMLRCKVCFINQVQYCMECGHAFCSTCADVLFNVEDPKCGICRTRCNREPTPLFLI